MTLKERLQTETTAAMRSGDELRRDVLRMASNALYTLEKRQGEPPSAEQELQVLSREVKSRRESVEAFRNGGREDLATKEEAEIAILSEFLPQPLSEEEQLALVDEAIAATGATSVRELGKVMGWLSPRIRGRADGKHISELAAAGLARSDLAAHDQVGSR